MSDEDWEIAHDEDAPRVAGVANALPLLVEQELRQLVHPDLARAAGRPLRNRRRRALRDLGLPGGPGCIVVRGLDGHEKRVIAQPARVPMAEPIKAIARSRRRRLVEALQYLGPECLTMLDHR